jgi:acyl-CoA synthetase (NDP forming)
LGGSLLHPRSVALVGASDDPTKTTARPLAFLRKAGFEGAVYPVNPRRATVQGEQAWPSLADLPEVPDHAFLMTSTDGVAEAVSQCVELGVPVVTILAGGFGEEGEAGRAREAGIRRLLEGSSTRVLGPNSIGIVNVHTGLTLTANGAFAEPVLPRGGLFVASHSGSMIGAILSRGLSRGLGYAGFVSMGAELDLTLGELCEATLDDPMIDSYALFLESIQNGRALHRFALAAADRGKAVIAYKLGRSEQGAELSQSHTGAIAGEDGIADAFLRDAGIIRVDTFEGLIEGAMLARMAPATAGGRKPQVAVVTTTGGAAAMVVDQLGMRGTDVTAPSEATMAQLASRDVSAASNRIVDLTLAGTKPAVMSAALSTLAEAPEFDLVVAVAGSSARFQPELLVPGITEAAATARKPIVAFVAPEAPEAVHSLSQAGVPVFRTPESCGDAISAVFARRHPKPLSPAGSEGPGRQLDEAEGYGVIEGLGVPVAGFDVVTADAVRSDIGYPVAVKLLSSEVLHKSELGGVELDVADDEAMQAAVRRIVDAVPRAKPGLTVDRLLVQSMVESVGEVLLSVRRDTDAGLMVMLAAGGVLAEIHKDRSIRIAPVSRNEAIEMIGEVRSLQALGGYRGRVPGDLDALADAIVAISAAGPEVVEIEINPLLVRRDGEGVVAADAVVTIAGVAE